MKILLLIIQYVWYDMNEWFRLQECWRFMLYVYVRLIIYEHLFETITILNDLTSYIVTITTQIPVSFVQWELLQNLPQLLPWFLLYRQSLQSASTIYKVRWNYLVIKEMYNFYKDLKAKRSWKFSSVNK